MEGGEERNMEERNRNKKKQSDSAATAAGDELEKKKKKKKKQPIKVVYISNPMKVKATVAEFRSVVQGLTGRDSDLESSLSKYGDGAAVDDDEAPELPEAEASGGSAGGADLSGDASAKQVGECDHFDDDNDELPEFLPSPPAYFELQGHIHFRH